MVRSYAFTIRMCDGQLKIARSAGRFLLRWFDPLALPSKFEENFRRKHGEPMGTYGFLKEK